MINKEVAEKKNPKSGRAGQFLWPILIGVGALGVGGFALNWLTSGSGINYDGPTAEARRGDLTITVTESGNLRNRDQVIVSSRVEGRNTILWIIDEGQFVEEGDLLVELDSSELEDRLIEREISVQSAEADYIRAQQERKVTESRTQSEIAQARLALRFAELDFNKYTADDGEYRQELDRLEANIELAREELTRARQEYENSEKLAASEFITPLELERDRLAYERASVDVRIAEGNLRLLQDYTHQRQREQLQSDMEQAGESLERVIMRAEADMVQAAANYNARRQELERQKQQLARLEQQIAMCRIYAPAAGMVVYETSANPGRRGSQEPLEAGEEVRERQELIYLPASDGMIADITVHESALDRIAVGMHARVTVDARPGQIYQGTVRRIAPMPDAQSIWLNPDLTVYSTQVEVDADDLRTGMSCQVDIIVEELRDVVYVPLQSVIRYDRRHYVYVITPRGPEPRRVEIGLDNNRVVHVKSGVEDGEIVMLAPPIFERMDDEEDDEDEEMAPDIAEEPHVSETAA